MQNFTLRTAILAALFGALISLIPTFSDIAIPTIMYFVVLGFAAMNVFSFNSLVRSNKKTPARFISSFMGVITMKLLATIFFIGIYLYLTPDYRVQVAIGTFLVYMGNTILLIKAILSMPEKGE